MLHCGTKCLAVRLQAAGNPETPARSGLACVGFSLPSSQKGGCTRHEDRTGRAPDGKRAAAPLRRNGAHRLLPDRGPRRAGPRRHAVCERRLHHLGQARPVLHAGPAPQCRRPRSHPLLHADARQGASAGPRLRHHPLPHRPVPLPDLPRHRPSHGHDAARPAGSARHAAALRRLSRDAAGVDLGCAARARARRLLSRHRPSRPAARSAGAHAAPARRLPRVHRAHLAREARRPRHPHRARGRHSAQDRGQGRSRRHGLLQVGDRADAGWRPASSSSARSTSAARGASSARLAACCFPSIGPSPSVS